MIVHEYINNNDHAAEIHQLPKLILRLSSETLSSFVAQSPTPKPRGFQLIQQAILKIDTYNDKKTSLISDLQLYKS